jgi:formylglycine-generating enzyme required for sulfatase activity
MTNVSIRPLKVFLCHAHADRNFVWRLYDRLTKDGVDAWLDKANLLAGQDWKLEIEKSVRKADVVVVCLSKEFNREGFRQKEVRWALDTAMEKPEGEIFIIPARWEECDILESLSQWHWVDLFENDGYDRLMKALRARANQIGAVLQSGINQQPAASPSAPKPPWQTPIPAPQKNVDVARVTTPTPAVSIPRDERVALYNEARAFQAEGNLSKAAELFVKIGDYRDASLRLQKLQLYLDADKWMNQGFADKNDSSEPWEQARNSLNELLRLDAQFLDAPARLQTTHRWLALPETYEHLLDALDMDDWKQAYPLFEKIRAIKPNYQRAQTLFTQALPHIARTGVIKGSEMILIPAGEFVMGSDKSNAEKPPHTVYLDSFYIDRYPVTNTDYQYFVLATKHAPPAHWQNGKIPSGKEMHPVVNVSWNDATAYAQWIGKRLPTEAEWEKAASWDDRKKEKRVYPWEGNFDASKCNSQEAGIGDTTPVGKYSPQGDSFYGIADMAGNVWEWCTDWYDENYYKNSPKENPMGASSGQYRVLRGGSWGSSDYYARSANRGGDSPDVIVNYIGFRCARSLP